MWASHQGEQRSFRAVMTGVPSRAMDTVEVGGLDLAYRRPVTVEA